MQAVGKTAVAVAEMAAGGCGGNGNWAGRLGLPKP